MWLLACGGGGVLVLLVPFVLAGVILPTLVVKVAGYYFVGRSLARAHELPRSGGELMLVRLGTGLAGLSTAILFGVLVGSWAWALGVLTAARLMSWFLFGHFFITPHVALQTSEQATWVVLGTVWSFFLDAIAAAVVLGSWYSLAVLTR